MSDWTRDQLWADQDAAHQQQLGASAIVTYAILVLAWSVLALIGYALGALRRSPIMHEDTIERTECANADCAVRCSIRGER